MADARIQEAASEHAALLRTLAATEHAKPTLAALGDRLAELQQQVYAMDPDLRAAHAATTKEKAELDALEHQHVRKWFQDRGARRQQLEKERGEYLAALGAQEKLVAASQAIHAQIRELRAERDRLRAQVDEHVAATVALEALYGRVFAGPTPASPEEDALEARVQAVQAAHDAVQQRLFLRGRVSNEVHLALACANRAAAAMGRAIDASIQDILLFGEESHVTALAGQQDPRLSSMTFDLKERDAMRDAQRDIAEAEQHMAAAQLLEPDAVGDFFRPTFADAHSKTAHLDMWLDTPITDYLFHRRLEDTLDNVNICHRVLTDEAARANTRLEAVRQELEPLAAELDQLRQELFALRADVYARLAKDEAK